MHDTSFLSPWIRRFLMEHMIQERNLARNTQCSYRDTLRMLLPVIARRVRKSVDRLSVTDLSADRLREFLNDLEKKQDCGISTRNQRLAAVHALARFIGLHAPELVEWCGQIRMVPFKKAPKVLISYLEKPEMDGLLAAPDQRTAQGRRDHALLLFLYNSGARASEAAQVRITDLTLPEVPDRDLASVLIRGKGNKPRRCPLWAQTVRELAVLVQGRIRPSSVSQSMWPTDHAVWYPYADRALRGPSCPKGPILGREAGQPAHHSSHDGDPPSSLRRRHQHHSGMARARVPDHNQHLRGSGFGNESQGIGQL